MSQANSAEPRALHRSLLVLDGSRQPPIESGKTGPGLPEASLRLRSIATAIDGSGRVRSPASALHHLRAAHALPALLAWRMGTSAGVEILWVRVVEEPSHPFQFSILIDRPRRRVVTFI